MTSRKYKAVEIERASDAKWEKENREWLFRAIIINSFIKLPRLPKKIRGSFTKEEWDLKKQTFNNHCVYCGEEVEELTADHWISRHNGGTDHISNILPACKHCNSSKHTKNGDDFAFKGATQMVMPSILADGT